ncbi:sulfite oxidase heme-binding subunit YedZ [Chloroflexota bacterium]
MVLLGRIKSNWLRIVVHIAAWVPLAWIAWHYWQGLYLVDPVREITTITGKTALILLMLSLACTPINTVFGWKRVIRVRRALGVYAFMYAALHFLVFIGLDYRFDFGLIWQAIFDQRYVLVGFAAGVILLVLAITSTRGWKRRLRKAWKRLHKLVYAAGILAVVHFLWLMKDAQEPSRYALILAALLFLRIPNVRRTIVRARRRLGAAWQQRSVELST